MHVYTHAGAKLGGEPYQIFSDHYNYKIGGRFNEWLNLTLTILVRGAKAPSSGLYVCEVCSLRGTPLEECHLANTSLQVIGGPPILDKAEDNSEFISLSSL